jgi:hypothetical protein
LLAAVLGLTPLVAHAAPPDPKAVDAGAAEPAKPKATEAKPAEVKPKAAEKPRLSKPVEKPKPLPKAPDTAKAVESAKALARPDPATDPQRGMGARSVGALPLASDTASPSETAPSKATKPEKSEKLEKPEKVAARSGHQRANLRANRPRRCPRTFHGSRLTALRAKKSQMASRTRISARVKTIPSCARYVPPSACFFPVRWRASSPAGLGICLKQSGAADPR